jgi:hypothetical protein
VDEPITLEHAVVTGERVGKLSDNNSDWIVAAIGASSSFLDRCGNSLVVSFGELVAGR